MDPRHNGDYDGTDMKRSGETEGMGGWEYFQCGLRVRGYHVLCETPKRGEGCYLRLSTNPITRSLFIRNGGAHASRLFVVSAHSPFVTFFLLNFLRDSSYIFVFSLVAVSRYFSKCIPKELFSDALPEERQPVRCVE